MSNFNRSSLDHRFPLGLALWRRDEPHPEQPNESRIDARGRANPPGTFDHLHGLFE